MVPSPIILMFAVQFQIVWDSLYSITYHLTFELTSKAKTEEAILPNTTRICFTTEEPEAASSLVVVGQLRNCFSSRESHLHINAVVLLATRQCFKGFWNWFADALGIKSPQCINLSLIRPKHNKTDLWQSTFKDAKPCKVENCSWNFSICLRYSRVKNTLRIW